MTEEQSKRRVLGRIRDAGGNVADAARSVTGQSAASDIAEFTNAYTEVLTGLNSDIRTVQRRVAELEHAQKLAVNAPLVVPRVDAAADRRVMAVAILALAASVIAVILSLMS